MKKNNKETKKPAHRPLKYGEETELVPIRMPKSKKAAVKNLVYDYLKQFEK